MLRILSVLSLVGFLAFGNSTTEAAQKKKKGKALHGVATEVTADKKESNLGTLTVKTKGKKGAPGADKTIQVTKDTKIEKVTGKKGEKQRTAAAFSDLGQGQNLIVHLNPNQPDQAARVEIIAKKKKKAA